MVGPLLALAAATLWGAADFAGGTATKRSPLLSVLAPSQGIGLLLVLALIVVLGRPAPVGADLAWGAIAGVASAIGLGALYRALAGGQMGVVAALAGAGSAIIPVVVGIVRGEQIGVLQVPGIVCALVAVVLVARPRAGRLDSSLILAGLAALGLGLGLVFLQQAGRYDTFWTLVASRAASVACLVTVGGITRQSLAPSPSVTVPVVLAGVLDIAANGLYVAASQRGLLSLIAVLASLYPVATAVLARLILSERLARSQQAGVALALGGAALIAAG